MLRLHFRVLIEWDLENRLPSHTTAPCKMCNFEKKRTLLLGPIVFLVFNDDSEEGLLYNVCTMKN